MTTVRQISPEELSKWCSSLAANGVRGQILRDLQEQILRKHIDGSRFDNMLKTNTLTELGVEELNPRMALSIRRTWNADFAGVAFADCGAPSAPTSHQTGAPRVAPPTEDRQPPRQAPSARGGGPPQGGDRWQDEGPGPARTPPQGWGRQDSAQSSPQGRPGLQQGPPQGHPGQRPPMQSFEDQGPPQGHPGHRPPMQSFEDQGPPRGHPGQRPPMHSFEDQGPPRGHLGQRPPMQSFEDQGMPHQQQGREADHRYANPAVASSQQGPPQWRQGAREDFSSSFRGGGPPEGGFHSGPPEGGFHDGPQQWRDRQWPNGPSRGSFQGGGGRPDGDYQGGFRGFSDHPDGGRYPDHGDGDFSDCGSYSTAPGGGPPRRAPPGPQSAAPPPRGFGGSQQMQDPRAPGARQGHPDPGGWQPEPAYAQPSQPSRRGPPASADDWGGGLGDVMAPRQAVRNVGKQFAEQARQREEADRRPRDFGQRQDEARCGRDPWDGQSEATYDSPRAPGDEWGGGAGGPGRYAGQGPPPMDGGWDAGDPPPRGGGWDAGEAPLRRPPGPGGRPPGPPADDCWAGQGLGDALAPGARRPPTGLGDGRDAAGDGEEQPPARPQPRGRRPQGGPPADDSWGGQSLGDCFKKAPPPAAPSGGGSGSRRPEAAPMKPGQDDGKSPDDICKWLKSLPLSHVPEKAQNELCAVVEEGNMGGQEFDRYVKEVPPEICAPRHAMKLKAAWANMLKEAECREVAISNLANQPKSKGVALTL